MATAIGNVITLDGQFADWPASDAVMTPGNTVAGYQVYGALLNDATLGNTYVIGIDATASITDPAIAADTTIYRNTDQNTATGYNLSFANVGAEYEVQFASGSNDALQPFLYSVTSAGATTFAQRRRAARIRPIRQWRKRPRRLPMARYRTARRFCPRPENVRR
jgi:hypothetical protein